MAYAVCRASGICCNVSVVDLRCGHGAGVGGLVESDAPVQPWHLSHAVERGPAVAD